MITNCKAYTYKPQTIKLYTLEDAERILERKIGVLSRGKEHTTYFFKQKLCGIIMIGLGVVIPIIDGDATISLFTIPIGLGLLLTKKRVMCFRGKE